MAKPSPPPKLVRDLCRILAASMFGRPLPYWMSIDPIGEVLGVPREHLDETVAEAVRRGLVRVDARLTTSVTITGDGLAVASEPAEGSGR